MQLFCISSFAANLKLVWNPNTEPDVSHYIIRWGLSGAELNNTVNVPHVAGNNEIQTVITGLDTDKTYYISLTCVDTYEQSSPAAQISIKLINKPVSILADSIKKLENGNVEIRVEGVATCAACILEASSNLLDWRQVSDITNLKEFFPFGKIIEITPELGTIKEFYRLKMVTQ
jgi:hypothetical protein